MRNRSHVTKSPADPAAAHIEISLYPYRDDTAATVTLVSGLGTRTSRLRLWRGHLPCNRGDLRGMGPRHVSLLLCRELLDALEHPQPHPIAPGADSALGESGAPLGAMGGGTWDQPQLPFELPYTHTPPGIAHV